MVFMIYYFLISLISYAVLDAIWLGVIIRPFMSAQLNTITRSFSDFNVSHILSTIAVYILLALGTTLFILIPHKAESLIRVALWGAVFGGIVFGVYDFTNYAVLSAWPWKVLVVDIAWGITAGFLATLITKLILK